jgi:hypothetical protein
MSNVPLGVNVHVVSRLLQWGSRSILLLVLATCIPVLRADVTGSISGTITDSSGAVIPDASVLALNTDTDINHTTRTNTQGYYVFPILPTGHYTITIQGRGFKEYRQTGLTIDVNSALRVDAKLELGAVTQEVNVSASAVQVDTTSTQMGEVIGGNKIEAVPLNGRSFTDLISLQPGVVPIQSGDYNNNQPSGGLDTGTFSVSGQRESANGFMLNGGNVEESMWMGTAIVPNLDSIAEFRIITNNADPEYGNYAGGLVNVITKSGTNRFHGDVFEFLRNSDMDSRNFYDSSRGTLHQNEFGGTIGGPIKHDRLFFFSDYQGQRLVTGLSSALTSVPSNADRSGNLSDIASQLTGNVAGSYWAGILTNRLGYAVTPGEPYYYAGCNSGAQCVLPNATLPTTGWDAPSSKLLAYIPAPNLGATNYQTSSQDDTLRDDKWSSRIDANTGIGLISGYYFFDDFSSINPYGGAPFPGFSASNQGRAQNFNLGITTNFGASKVNEFRANYVRDIIFSGYPIGGRGPTASSLGFTVGSGSGTSFNGGFVPIDDHYPGVPEIALSNFSFGMDSNTRLQYNNTYEVADNYSIVHGTHTLKMGGAVHYMQIENNPTGGGNWVGEFIFNGTETGNSFADFLLGAPDEYEGGVALPIWTRSWYYGAYFQDTWRATHNLTVNYGLRWDVSSPWSEAHNEFETLVPGEQSKVFPGAPLGWVFPTDPGVAKTIAPVRHRNFAPRLGLAYAPTTSAGFLGKLIGGPGKTSIRASWGMFYTAYEDANNLNVQGDAPYGNFYASPFNDTLDSPYVNRQTGAISANPFANLTIPPYNTDINHPDTSFNWAPDEYPEGQISSSPGFGIHNRLPYTEHWSLSIERELSPNTIFSIAYVGSQSHHLVAGLESNPSDPALCLSLSQPSEVMPGTATCGPRNEDTAFYPITGGVVLGTRHPFGINFGSNDYVESMANAFYEGLETSLRHTSGRSEFLLGYTYSKSLDNSSSNGNNGAPNGGDMVNFMNPNISRALSAFDMTHIFVASYSYRIPFDKAWRPNRLTNGWVVTGITRFSTGLPISLEEYDDHSLLGTNSAGGVGVLDVPNYTGARLNITNPRLANTNTLTNPYFNISAFPEEALGQLGDANHRFFHGPGLNNWDLALMKDLRLTESKRLEFRGEFFNTFNHAQFAVPSRPIGYRTNALFGFVTAAEPPRIGQVSMKFIF